MYSYMKHMIIRIKSRGYADKPDFHNIMLSYTYDCHYNFISLAS